MLARLLGLVLLATGCAAPPPLVTAGSAEARPVAVDGDAADWGASLLAVTGTPLAVGVRSDAQALTVAVVTSDREAIRQILQTGLSIWFDADGGTDRAVGLTFPYRAPGEASPPAQSDAERAERFAAVRPRVALTSGGQTTVTEADAVPGVALAAGFDGATFVAELRVPLTVGTGPFGVGAAPSRLLGLGFETRAPEGDRLRERLDENASRGGQVGGRAQQRGAGVPPEALRAQPEVVELWLRVALSE